jgi:hypothetical protein
MLDNLGELAKPIDTLVSKIADATGVLYEPTRIRRKAKAEAEALIIRTKAEIDVGEIQNRAITRLVTEEIQKQENIEDITEISFKFLNDDAKPENIEKDWLFNFFDKSKLISNENMQELWAKILAGESNSPGTYTKRFLNFIEDLDMSDAKLITKLLNYCWYLEGIIISPLINFTKELSVLSFSEKKYLEEIGIFQSVGLMGYGHNIEKGEELFYKYCDKQIKIINKTNDVYFFQQGTIKFTKNAEQLLSSIMDEKILDNFQEDYYNNMIIEFRKNKGLEVVEL